MSRRSKDRREASTAKARRRWDDEPRGNHTTPPRRSGPGARGRR